MFADFAKKIFVAEPQGRDVKPHAFNREYQQVGSDQCLQELDKGLGPDETKITSP